MPPRQRRDSGHERSGPPRPAKSSAAKKTATPKKKPTPKKAAAKKTAATKQNAVVKKTVAGKKAVAAKKKSVPAKKPVASKAGAAKLHIDTHRGLIGKRYQMIEALQRKPDLLPLLAINPVQAFHDAGVTMSPEIAAHVMDSIRFPPALRTERDRLTAELSKLLKEEPNPTSGTWLARTLFGKLRLQPLDLRGQTPAYLPSIEPEATRRMSALLRQSRPDPSAPMPHSTITVGLARQSDRLLDLDAAVPTCPPAKHRPERLSLAELWFYRDQHEVVPPLLRLGVVLKSGVMLASPSVYKHIAGGARRNQLMTWISAVKFPDRADRA